jgi:cytochrome c oxidase subunit 3
VSDHAHNADTAGARIGMWFFLYTEIMLFGGLFIAYAWFYHRYSSDFIEAGKALDVTLGAANTLILLVSSFFVAASITAIRRGATRATKGLLIATIALGLTFLVNKYFEWGQKFADGIYPGSDALAAIPHGQTIFYGLYYSITGLHGLHVLIGVVVLSLALTFVTLGKIRPGKDIFLENSGLYWHLVDLIWIFVFPLFYLIL